MNQGKKYGNKSLFNEDNAYNGSGIEFADESKAIIEPLLNKWAGEGFNVRDINMVISAELSLLFAEALVYSIDEMQKRRVSVRRAE